MKKQQKLKLEATLNKWATEIGVDDATLTRWLVRAGHKHSPGALIPARKIFRAALADEKAERARLTRAQADKTETETQQLKGELINREQFTEQFWNAVLLPFRTDLLEVKKRHPECAATIEAFMDKHFHDKPAETKNEKLKAQS